MQSYVLMLQTDVDDIYITESTLSEIGNTIPVQFISDLEEMEQHIAKNGEPAVILLNDRGTMNRGLQVLKSLKTNAAYAHIPVVMLGEYTTSDYIREIYKAGANTYIVKPSTVAATKKKIETFFSYWFEVAAT